MVATHPCFANCALHARYWERGRTVREEGSNSYAVLRDVDGNPIVRPDHFRQLRLQKAWSILQFAGRLPQPLDGNTSAEEKA